MNKALVAIRLRSVVFLTNAVLLDVAQEVAVRFVAESNGRYVDLKGLPDIGK